MSYIWLEESRSKNSSVDKKHKLQKNRWEEEHHDVWETWWYKVPFQVDETLRAYLAGAGIKCHLMPAVLKYIT